jgi:hypothetical protein
MPLGFRPLGSAPLAGRRASASTVALVVTGAAVSGGSIAFAASAALAASGAGATGGAAGFAARAALAQAGAATSGGSIFASARAALAASGQAVSGGGAALLGLASFATAGTGASGGAAALLGRGGLAVSGTAFSGGGVYVAGATVSGVQPIVVSGAAFSGGSVAFSSATLIPLRTWAYSMLADAVRQALPGAAVERDRTPPIGLARLPAVFISTGDHAAGEPAIGEVLLACQMTVAWRGWSATAANRTDAAYEAHGAVAAALDRRFSIQGQPVWPIQSDFALDLEGGEQAGKYLVGWSATWSFELLAPIGNLTQAV